MKWTAAWARLVLLSAELKQQELPGLGNQLRGSVGYFVPLAPARGVLLHRLLSPITRRYACDLRDIQKPNRVGHIHNVRGIHVFNLKSASGLLTRLRESPISTTIWGTTSRLKRLWRQSGMEVTVHEHRKCMFVTSSNSKCPQASIFQPRQLWKWRQQVTDRAF